MRDRSVLAGVAGVFTFALALRLGPLYWSPLPFNPDGIGYAATVRDALALGRLPLSEMATDQVGFTALLSVVSALVGDPPLTIAQPTSAFIGAATIPVATLFAYLLARDADWSRERAAMASLVAGLLLAVEGIYLYRSMPTDEQTAGLLLVPTAVLAVDRWVRTADRRWAAVAIPILAVIPPLHNLTGLVTAIAVSLVGTVAVVRNPERSTAGRSVAVSVGTWLYVVGYHLVVAEYTGAAIVQADRLVRVPGLFAAWVVLAAGITAWFVTTKRGFQRGTVVAIVGTGFGLVLLNTVRTVFPGTTATPRPLVLVLLPLVVPAVVAASTAHVAARSRSVGGPTIALVAAPLAIVGTALTAQLTFEYLALVYRSQLFAHLPLLALAGVGAVTVLGGDRDRVTAVLVVLVVVCSLASTPIAYAGLELRTYKSLTTESEFHATADVSDAYDSWASDDHLARIAGYHGGNGRRSPTYDWLRGGAPPPGCPVLAQASWTGIGAQFHPQRPASLSPVAYREWQLRNDVVYAVDAADPLKVVVPRRNATTC